MNGKLSVIEIDTEGRGTSLLLRGDHLATVNEALFGSFVTSSVRFRGFGWELLEGASTDDLPKLPPEVVVETEQLTLGEYLAEKEATA